MRRPMLFGFIDAARRQAGNMLDTSGLGPQETPFRVLAEMPGARLRAYAAPDAEGPALLILPAPFKRAYIWDLLPEVSVVRHALSRGLRVYLLEWLPPGEAEDGFGLAEYADRLPAAALDAIAAETGAPGAILAGHSFGGTFAAIFASLHPARVKGLALLDAPLAFGAHGGRIAQAVRVMPHARLIRQMAGSPIPGTVVDLLSVGALPDAFQLQRFSDLGQSLFDSKALAIHTRVERWTLDEFPLPGQLFEEILERLYREDRFMHGTLEVAGRATGMARIEAPVIAVVNPLGRVVPPDSMLAALQAVPDLETHVLRYEGGRGPAIQHLGPLVAPIAHERLWPEILDWMRAKG